MTRHLSKTLGAAALAALMPFAAMAQENLGWHGSATTDGAILYYGIPQSDHAPLSFSCASDGTGLTFVFVSSPHDASASAAVELRLQAGDIEVPIQTTGMYTGMQDYSFEGYTTLDDRLADLITSDGTLMVFVEDGVEEFPVEEFPLAGAGEAAAPLLETCAGQAVSAEVAQTTICRIYGWSTDPDPEGLNVRSGPGTSHPVIGLLPPPQEIEGERFATEFSITGSRDGWFRIDEATINNYIVDAGPDVVFDGEGWVSGEFVGFWVEANALLAKPSHHAPTTFDVTKLREEHPDNQDFWRELERVHACMGNWADVEITVAEDRFRGWTTDICPSQVTTCP